MCFRQFDKGPFVWIEGFPMLDLKLLHVILPPWNSLSCGTKMYRSHLASGGFAPSTPTGALPLDPTRGPKAGPWTPPARGSVTSFPRKNLLQFENSMLASLHWSLIGGSCEAFLYPRVKVIPRARKDATKKNLILINKSRTAWSTKILMSCLSFSDNLLQDNHIIFQKNAADFEKVHKTCLILVWGAVPPLGKWILGPHAL